MNNKHDPWENVTFQPWGPYPIGAGNIGSEAAPWVALLLFSYVFGVLVFGLHGVYAVLAGLVPMRLASLLLWAGWRRLVDWCTRLHLERLERRPTPPRAAPRDNRAWQEFIDHWNKHRNAVDPFGLWRPEHW